MKTKELQIKVKPVFLKAWKWDESRKTFNQIGCKYLSCSGHEKHPDLMSDLKIETLNGGSRVGLGDYIIKNDYGFFVVNEGSFKRNYELLNE